MQPLIHLLKHDVVWKDNRVVPKYCEIIGDIIKLYVEWESRMLNCFLDIQHINIIDDRLDNNVMLSSADQNTKRTCKAQFKVLVTKILHSENRRPVELTHFYDMASSDKMNFHNLWHHPLLMASHERYKFPKNALAILGSVSHWIEDYKSYEKSKYKDERKRNTNIINNIQSSKHHIAFNYVYVHDKDSYEDNVVGVLNYTTKIADHLGEHFTKTHPSKLFAHEIEEALTALFPERLIDLFEFLVVHKNLSVGTIEAVLLVHFDAPKKSPSSSFAY
ncbi:unnamed protein product [Prunus brigantina]